VAPVQNGKGLVRPAAFILAEGREQRRRFLARMHEWQAVTNARHDAQLRMLGEMMQFGGVLYRNEANCLAVCRGPLALN